MKTPPYAPRLRDYGQLLLDSWIVICCSVILSALAGWGVYANRAPVYTAEAKLFATVPGGAGTRSALSGNQDAITRVETYAQLATSAQVLSRTADAVAAQGGDASMTPAQLADDGTAAVVPGSVLLALSVTGPDPKTVSDTANLWAGNLIEVAKEIEWADGPTTPGPTGELVLVDGAVSTTETKGALSRYLSLGAGLGLVVSSALVLARGIRRSAVVTTNQLDHETRALTLEFGS